MKSKSIPAKITICESMMVIFIKCAFFNISNATKFKAIVIASPTNPIILNDFIFLRV